MRKAVQLHWVSTYIFSEDDTISIQANKRIVDPDPFPKAVSSIQDRYNQRSILIGLGYNRQVDFDFSPWNF